MSVGQGDRGGLQSARGRRARIGDLGTAIRRHELWRSKVAVRAYSMARSAADAVGLQLVLKTYYSPIPDVRRLPPGFWIERDPLRGLEFDLDGQVALLGELSEYLREFAPGGGAYGYVPDNPSYPEPDARLLYAMIRRHRPRTVVELGSGHSSRVIAQACLANERDGAPVAFRAFEPYPIAIDAGLPGLAELVRVGVDEVPEETFTGLGAGDLLVVDTTHVVKMGSDVNRIVLRFLPLLAPGVVVHFHDICLPYEYPKYFADLGLYWGEQYLLQAFLSLNASFEVMCAVYALCRERPDEVAATGLAGPEQTGGAFWIRRVA